MARQGNLLLWGFDASLDTLTADGRRLFAALLEDHARRPFVPFEELKPRIEYVAPGRFNGDLTCQFADDVLHFRLNGPGRIRATLYWRRGAERLALILNGPGRRGYYAREDGRSPLEIDFPVTPEIAGRGSEWTISVNAFHRFQGPIRYTLDLDFPR